MPILPPLSIEQIDAILPFLDRLDGLTDFDEGDDGREFVQALYDNGWVSPAFDWPNWQKTAKTYVDSPQKIEAARATTIQKLLTTHARVDHFSRGHFASMFRQGHIIALLRRLKTIRATMS